MKRLATDGGNLVTTVLSSASLIDLVKAVR